MIIEGEFHGETVGIFRIRIGHARNQAATFLITVLNSAC
jgi:hypothetical protein